MNRTGGLFFVDITIGKQQAADAPRIGGGKHLRNEPPSAIFRHYIRSANFEAVHQRSKQRGLSRWGDNLLFWSFGVTHRHQIGRYATPVFMEPF
jgi:hypothetical protein